MCSYFAPASSLPLQLCRSQLQEPRGPSQCCYTLVRSRLLRSGIVQFPKDINLLALTNHCCRSWGTCDWHQWQPRLGLLRRLPPSKLPRFQRSHSPNPGREIIVPCAQHSWSMLDDNRWILCATDKESYFDFESHSGLVSSAIAILTKVRPVRVLCWNPTMGQHPLRKI